MSYGRGGGGHNGPYWDRGPPWNGPPIDPSSTLPFQPPESRDPTSHHRGHHHQHGHSRGRSRHDLPPEQHKPYSPLPPIGNGNGYAQPQHFHRHMHTPSTDEIDNLQARLRSMLVESQSAPRQQSQIYPPVPQQSPQRHFHHPPQNVSTGPVTVPTGPQQLYHSPPFHNSQPQLRNFRNSPRKTPHKDTCDDITAYVFNIVDSLQIPDDERLEKEEFLRDLQQLVKTLRPNADVQVFGSFANTFTIANSDIDCCITEDKVTSDELQQSGLPEKLQVELDKLGFETTLLSLTRIPILKIFRPATDTTRQQSADTTSQKKYKYPLHCDVGWQNRLALHNTRLLKTYSSLDPRVRQIVLFVKYWTKTRAISRPRYGTLCSYGYVLMVLYYLTHVASPPVLPNLQCIPNRGVTRLEDVECEGCNIYFSRDADGWKTQNTESVGELVKGFFNFYAYNYYFKNSVISIRSPNGLLTKEAKNWTTLAETTGSQAQTIKSRYLIAIEDPFEISHNVARTVNTRGRVEIRGEFLRAAKMLNNVHGRKWFLKDFCVERVLPEYVPKPVSKGEDGEKESNDNVDMGENEDGDEDESVVDEEKDVQIKVLMPPRMGDQVLQDFEL